MPYFRHLTNLSVQHLKPAGTASRGKAKSKRRKVEAEADAGPESMALRIQVSDNLLSSCQHCVVRLLLNVKSEASTRDPKRSSESAFSKVNLGLLLR